MSNRALTIREVAERYAVDEHTVLAWIKTGELRAIAVNRKPGARKKRWRVTAESLTSFEMLRTYSPPPPRTRRRKQSAEMIQFH